MRRCLDLEEDGRSEVDLVVTHNVSTLNARLHTDSILAAEAFTVHTGIE